MKSNNIMNEKYEYIGLVEFDEDNDTYRCYHIVKSKKTGRYFEAEISNIGIYAVNSQGFDTLEEINEHLFLYGERLDTDMIKCPVCKKIYEKGTHALSRYVKLNICSQCGTNEAFNGPSDVVKDLMILKEMFK